jgi:hypothetical protein
LIVLPKLEGLRLPLPAGSNHLNVVLPVQVINELLNLAGEVCDLRADVGSQRLESNDAANATSAAATAYSESSRPVSSRKIS